ncbi:hypothetical protein DERF_009433 [Dermatophagoides farinae]|uniref:Uncharacterized protein n=1 Tax=Dermatophagoides farinae TaxID=6954 RepID=A0A922HWX8_DERFA|nr:hypothetical protein DERF_009433 [Dermatophagoides farinae]
MYRFDDEFILFVTTDIGGQRVLRLYKIMAPLIIKNFLPQSLSYGFMGYSNCVGSLIRFEYNVNILIINMPGEHFCSFWIREK